MIKQLRYGSFSIAIHFQVSASFIIFENFQKINRQRQPADWLTVEVQTVQSTHKHTGATRFMV